MNMIPQALMQKVNESTGDIGEDNNIYRDIIPMSNGVDNDSVSTEDNKTKSKCFNNRTPYIFMKLCGHYLNI